MWQMHEASLAASMLRSADLSQSYQVSMIPWIKDNSKRSKLMEHANKNSALYLDNSDNRDEAITMESIFKKLTKGLDRGNK